MSAAVVAVGLACRDPTGLQGGTVVEGSVRTRWYVPQDGGLPFATPVLDEALVYVPLAGGGVIARERSTGAERWRAMATPGEELRGGNFVLRGTVLIASSYSHVAALDAQTGAPRWRYAAPPGVTRPGEPARPGAIMQHVLDADDTVAYIPAWGASVSAVDLRTGQARWVWEPGPVASDSGAPGGRWMSGADGVRVSGDTVYVAAWHSLDDLGMRCEGWVLGLDRASGRELWRVTLPEYTGGVCMTGAPAPHGSLVLTTSLGGYLWAIDPVARRIAWATTPTPQFATFSGVALRDGVAYVDGADEWLYAYDATTGRLVWKAHPGNGATSQIVVSGHNVYYITYGTLRIFERRTGRHVATLKPRTEGHVMDPPVIADGRVYLFATDGVWCFDEP